ncbi:putative pentatricopeptide repeat-containing protein At5g37570 [Neltuma alba]|uniref:putative pentatricopeptide repeat-containing protein At5g37570 n=1 Tax=Neltuma alba TaxID=207710 RepID=UPI0010A4ECCA|nr:putative pentatricopeptide repeat-containing protein At5g37570 [Prosopis alba]
MHTISASLSLIIHQKHKTSTLIGHFLNTGKTIDHLRQAQAVFLRQLATPHHYQYFAGRLLLRILQCPGDNLRYASRVFDQIPRCRNGFLWTLLIRKYALHDHFHLSISLYARMHENGVSPSGFTFSSVLNACCRIPAISVGKQVHARVSQSGLCKNKIVQTAILDMYAKCRLVSDARAVFDEMSERDVVAWTAMIRAYTKVGMMIDAMGLFENMEERNSYTWTTMVAGYANNGDMKAARELYDMMKEKDKVTWVAMIAGYGKCGDVKEARRVFDDIPVPDASSFAAMVACYAQNGFVKEAIMMYSNMREGKIRITDVAMVGAISACAQLRDVHLSRTFSDQLEDDCCGRTLAISNALIHMHSKCGNIDLAWREFNRMSNRDVITYSALITALAEHGKSQDALDLFLKMQKEGVKPNQITFVGVLNACSHAGLVEKGCMYFKQMTCSFGIKPLSEHYSCMVDLLGRAGQLERACNLIQESARDDATAWGSLLGACRVHGDAELGEIAARRLFEIDPNDSGNYVILANTYASKDRWDDVEKVKKMMSEKRMIKPPGCSWI